MAVLSETASDISLSVVLVICVNDLVILTWYTHYPHCTLILLALSTVNLFKKDE